MMRVLDNICTPVLVDDRVSPRLENSFAGVYCEHSQTERTDERTKIKIQITIGGKLIRKQERGGKRDKSINKNTKTKKKK